MTAEGVDYAWARPNIAQLAAAGKRFAVRYVSYDISGKNLSAAEASALSAAGIAVVTNWEWDARDQLGGYNAGVQHAREADRQHRACGGPTGRPIYFSTDFDATAAQLAGPVAQYFRGVASVLGLARVGVYGGIRTVRYLLDNGLARWAWQTYAWSGGAWEPRANLQQYRNGVKLAGGTVDLDRAMTADYGQWTVGGPIFDPIADPIAGTTPSTQEDNMLHGQVPPGQTPIVVCTPWNKSSISFGCDFGKAKLRVAEHEVNVGWRVHEIVIDSTDAHRHDLGGLGNLRVNIDRRCIMRVPIDANDKMSTPVGYLAWWA